MRNISRSKKRPGCCKITLVLLNPDYPFLKTVDPDQLASDEANSVFFFILTKSNVYFATKRDHLPFNLYGHALFGIFTRYTCTKPYHAGTGWSCLTETLSCGYSLDLSHRDKSNEYPQDRLWCKQMHFYPHCH